MSNGISEKIQAEISAKKQGIVGEIMNQSNHRDHTDKRRRSGLVTDKNASQEALLMERVRNMD